MSVDSVKTVVATGGHATVLPIDGERALLGATNDQGPGTGQAAGDVAARRLVQAGPSSTLVLPADGAPLPAPRPYFAPEKLEDRVGKAVALLDRPAIEWARDPHIVAALTYSDAFLGPSGQVAGSPLDRDTRRGDLDKITIRAVVERIGMQRGAFRARFFEAMRIAYNAQTPNIPATTVPPLRRFDFGSGGRNHVDAIDLFVAREGDPENPVVSTSGGIVIVAENGWTPDNRFATSSLRGGNTVAVYDPVTNRVHRYAHLQQVDVRPLQVVRPGERLGLVGHTGSDSSLGGGASSLGRGKHLHYEIRVFPNGVGAESRNVDDRALRAIPEEARAKANMR